MIYYLLDYYAIFSFKKLVIATLGDAGVGKTGLVNRLVVRGNSLISALKIMDFNRFHIFCMQNGEFHGYEISTIGADFVSQKLLVIFLSFFSIHNSNFSSGV